MLLDVLVDDIGDDNGDDDVDDNGDGGDDDVVINHDERGQPDPWLLPELLLFIPGSSNLKPSAWLEILSKKSVDDGDDYDEINSDAEGEPCQDPPKPCPPHLRGERACWPQAEKWKIILME